MAMVSASWDSDADAWNRATGMSPTAHNAHRDRVARRMANHTIATYTNSAASRDISSIPSKPTPTARATLIADACGRYDSGEPKVEKVTNRCDESVGHSGMPRNDTGFLARGWRPSSRAPWSIRSRPSRMTSRTTSSGMHAPLNSESAGSNGRSRPVEIWYER